MLHFHTRKRFKGGTRRTPMARRAWLSPPPLLALLLALAAAALCGAQLPHAKHSDPPVVVVVTWFRKNLTWLAQVPPARARVVIYSKGGGPDYTCASLPPFLTPPLLAFCADSFNADGREAHTMALFVADNLHNLPRLVLFLQDDEPVYKPVSRLSQLSDDAFAAWMSHVVRARSRHNGAACLPVLSFRTLPLTCFTGGGALRQLRPVHVRPRPRKRVRSRNIRLLWPPPVVPPQLRVRPARVGRRARHSLGDGRAVHRAVGAYPAVAALAVPHARGAAQRLG